MTVVAWVVAGVVGLAAVTLLIARFAGSNKAVSDDLTDEQLERIADAVDEEADVDPLTRLLRKVGAVGPDERPTCVASERLGLDITDGELRSATIHHHEGPCSSCSVGEEQK